MIYDALSRRALLLALPCLPATVRAFQSSEAKPTFSSTVKVVNVFATVRDKNGKLVDDLTKDDFALSEDGKPQPIQYFSRQTDLPLNVGVLMDTSMSERNMIGPEKEASRTFIEDILRPSKDKAFLIHFDREVELLQDLTGSREKLEKALDQLDKPQFSHPSDDSGGNGDGSDQQSGGGYGRGHGRGGGNRQGGTQLYDAIYLASNEVLKPVQGRKALVLLTDGEDRGSKKTVTEVITAAQRADVIVYSIHVKDTESQNPFTGFGGPGMGRHGGGMGRGGGGMGRGGGGGPYEPHTDGKKILQQISAETGGAYFEYSKKKSVGDLYAEIEAELRNQYSLGYTSNATDGSTEYRKIAVTLKDKKKYTVQARAGYYPQPSAASSAAQGTY